MNRHYLPQLILLALLLCLSACASIDGSLMDTAETLPKGHLRVSGYETTAIPAYNFITDHQNDPGNPDSEDKIYSVAALGLKLNYGLMENYELVISTDISIALNNAKLGLKYSLNRPDETFRMAIMPSVYFSNGGDEGLIDPGGGNGENMDYRVRGVELPLLVTYRVGVFAVTLSPRISYNRISYRRTGEDRDWDVYESYMAGLVASPSFKLKILTITIPELGVYFYPVKDGDFQVQPALTFGLGLEF